MGWTMVKANYSGETRIFHLPDRVGPVELTEAWLELRRSSRSVAWILEFSATVHIDYRALRSFASRVEREHGPFRPVRFAGLSPYCQEIVRFALPAGDWNFEMDDDDDSDALFDAPGGNEARAERAVERGQEWGAVEALWMTLSPPCPN